MQIPGAQARQVTRLVLPQGREASDLTVFLPFGALQSDQTTLAEAQESLNNFRSETGLTKTESLKR